MSRLTIDTSRPYDIIVGAGILEDVGKAIKSSFSYDTIAIITDDIVAELYGNTVKHSLETEGITVHTFVFPNGEASKNINTLNDIWEFLAAKELTRSDALLALGGGVPGDIAGFAAATYLRGIDYIQVPTTFLAAVDSAVGGKTAVNLKAGKNLAGSFYQPSLVYCDHQTMTTMEKERFNDGTAEALKYGILKNEALFELLSQGDAWPHMEKIITTCLTIKGELVKEDEFDTGRRQLLNLGHTIGHAIEKESSFSITHGHAVAIGIALISQIAEDRALCPQGTTQRIKKALENNSLPTESPYSMTALTEAMKRDKKRKGDTITFIMPEKIGQCCLYPVTTGELPEFLNSIGG
ncbi:MAG: 3-dehydroquinate synthase [Bacillota bacterium]|nr:3-dehydroquinate synthase [Bacillota bacterium]